LDPDALHVAGIEVQVKVGWLAEVFNLINTGLTLSPFETEVKALPRAKTIAHAPNTRLLVFIID
jgi:hypothetical protein